MVIFLIYFYAMHLWSVLAHRLDSTAFMFLALLPLLPALPIAMWCFIAQRQGPLINRTQQLLRASAGPDELMVRELEKQNPDHSKSNNSG